jgi:lysophospholipase L1-like esterase
VNQELPNMLNSWREDFQNSRIILLSANTKTNEVGETDQNDNKRYLYTPVITCGKEMFAFDDLNEFDVYLPDRLHPNAKGYELWSRCLKKGLGTIMTR